LLSWVFAVVVKSNHNVVRGNNVTLFLYFALQKWSPFSKRYQKIGSSENGINQSFIHSFMHTM
jgi:hypothetical protein